MTIDNIQKRITDGRLTLPRISQTTVLSHFSTPERAPEGDYYGVVLSGDFSNGVVAAVRIDAAGNADYHIDDIRDNKVYMGAIVGTITQRYTFKRNKCMTGRIY